MYFDRKDDYGFVLWAQAVKKRDHWTCQICGRRGVELNSHHILSWNDHPEDRMDILNGTTLCRICHDAFHCRYGHGNNTAEQFEEFRQICDMMIKTAQKNFEIERMREKVLKELDGYNYGP